MNELNSKSAGELAQLIHKKEDSSREVVEAHLDRIKEVNPEINAVTIVLEESALKLADEVDNSEADEKEKPFFGVPITIKENIDLIKNMLKWVLCFLKVSPSIGGCRPESEFFVFKKKERVCFSGGFRPNLELLMLMDVSNFPT